MPQPVNSSQSAERQFLESLRPQYEDKGYEFVVGPSSSDLPEFFGTYQPDAIAVRTAHKVAIEVKSRSVPANEVSIQRIRRLFQGHPDWHLTIAYIGGEPVHVDSLPIEVPTSVLARLHEANDLVAVGHLRAAFVSAWSLLEASLNSVHPNADKRPRTPGTVIQALAMNGNISSEAERSLRSLVQLRNRIVHGDLTAEPTKDDVAAVLDAVTSTLATAA